MTPEYERVLLERIKEGEYGLYREFVVAYQDRLYSFVLGMVKNEADASDICQETFLKSYKSLASFKYKARYSTWLFRIAYTTTMTYLKKKHKRGEVPLETDFAERMPAATMNNVVEESELAEILHRALSHLTTEQRVALQLWYEDEYTYQEIALTMGIPINTVKSHIRRGREMLKTILREKYQIETYLEG